MSADTEVKETATASAFVIFFGLALGGVGILLAALAVGIERAWNGRATRPRSQWADRVDYHTAWLDQDRKARIAARAARRKWLSEGADPQREPQRAPRSRRFFGWLHRTWSRTAVGSDRTRHGWSRFWAGFRAGLENARRASAKGAGFWDIWRSRRDVPDPDGPEPELGTEPATAGDPHDSPTEEPYETATVVDTVDLPGRTTTEPTSTEEPMTAPTQTSSPRSSSAGAVGETNLDQTAADLDAINKSINTAEELNDQMAAVASALAAQAAAAAERVSANGGTAATIQAVDEARALAEQIRNKTSELADLARAAGDATGAAISGLKPAQDAQDTLHSAGARGRFVDTATS